MPSLRAVAERLRERSKNYHYSEHPWGLRWEDCRQEPCATDKRMCEEIKVLPHA